jgi:hypothetical protein
VKALRLVIARTVSTSRRRQTFQSLRVVIGTNLEQVMFDLPPRTGHRWADIGDLPAEG